MLIGIGKLPATVQDRCLVINMVRKVSAAKRHRFRADKVKEDVVDLRSDLMLWCAENQSRMVDAEPEMPSQLNDRQVNVCEPLVVLADLAGGQWPERARKAIVEICNGDTAEDDSLDTQLLRDLREIFDGTEKMATGDLVARLLELETSPWGECNRGKPITPAWLSRRLKPFGVQPRTIRPESGKVAKGYCRALFVDAWDRYLSAPPPLLPIQTVTTLQPASTLAKTHFSEPLQMTLVTAPKSEESPVNMRVVTPVTLSKGGGGICTVLRLKITCSRPAFPTAGKPGWWTSPRSRMPCSSPGERLWRLLPRWKGVGS